MTSYKRSLEDIYDLFPFVREAVERVTGERPSDPDKLCEGDDRLLHALAAGPLVSEGLIDGPQQRDGLPRRQREVLRLVLDGLALRQVAEILGISHESVRTHASRARQRFGTDNTWQAAVVAELLGWLPK